MQLQQALFCNCIKTMRLAIISWNADKLIFSDTCYKSGSDSDDSISSVLSTTLTSTLSSTISRFSQRSVNGLSDGTGRSSQRNNAVWPDDANYSSKGCVELDFWPLIEGRIVNSYYRPDIVILCTQEEPLDGITHSQLLLGHMADIGYILRTSKYVQTSSKDCLQTSIYVKHNYLDQRIDVQTKVLLESTNLSRKHGALELTLIMDDLDISIINVHLPYNRFLNKSLLNKIVGEFVFDSSAPSVYFLAGSFNPEHSINNKLLQQVIKSPLDYTRYDSLNQNISRFLIREGVDGSGPNFAPTCKLSKKRQTSVDSDVDEKMLLKPFNHSVYRHNGDSGHHRDKSNIRQSNRKQTLVQQADHRAIADDFNLGFKTNWRWCDRILYGAHNRRYEVECVNYDRIDDPATSLRYLDHAIVCGSYYIEDQEMVSASGNAYI